MDYIFILGRDCLILHAALKPRTQREESFENLPVSVVFLSTRNPVIKAFFSQLSVPHNGFYFFVGTVKIELSCYTDFRALIYVSLSIVIDCTFANYCKRRTDQENTSVDGDV